MIVTGAGRHRPDVAVADPSHWPSNGSAQTSPASDKNKKEATDAMRRRRFILSSRCCRSAPFPKFVIRRSKLGHELREFLTELAAAMQKLQIAGTSRPPLVITSIYRWWTALQPGEMSRSEPEVPLRAVKSRGSHSTSWNCRKPATAAPAASKMMSRSDGTGHALSFRECADNALSHLDHIDRPRLDISAHARVEARVARGEDMQGGEHGVGGLEHGHHRHVARRAQR